jgi:signal transduction histidine kinase/ActR/RegA family two-component response regulator
MADANEPAKPDSGPRTEREPSRQVEDRPAGGRIPDLPEMTAVKRTADVANREGAVAAREETATLREGAAGMRDEAADRRDDTATLREGAAGIRDEAADRRDDTATLREDAARLREEAAGLREETSTLREEAVRVREEAARARLELEELMLQARDANERLVVATIRAQTMTENAEQANRLKDEFLATVSHELRTPLNAVMGWARILGSMQLPPDRAAHAIAIVERNASALAYLIEDLLDVSRIVAGTLHLEAQVVSLPTVALAALESVQPLALDKKVEVMVTHGPEPIDPVRGDPARLEQVLWNLLANAIKFTPAGGRVDLFIERSEHRVEIRVVDTGQGISPDFLPHVFERFLQAEGATTRRHGGLGVGLAIVRQLVQLHGGTVRADSEGPGRGATFTIHLPIAADETPAKPVGTRGDRRTAETGASPMPHMPRLDALRILVVDDDADGCALTSLVLTQAGATVRAAASVREALQMLEAERPDVLVSDLGLPDADGYTLIRHVRQQEREHGGSLPAVALTGYARAEDRARVLAAGFQAHVAKPVDPVELAAAIAAITPRRRNGTP